MNNKTENKVFQKIQQQDLNGAALYEEIAKFTRNDKENGTLQAISRDEYKHAAIFGKYSGLKLKPNRIWVNIYAIVAHLLGYTFIIKVLERIEDQGISAYQNNINLIPELNDILKEEEIHEQSLMDILDEERLQYIGDIVLGMNDALVELTGSLAGYTLAMQNTSLIAMAGLITGVSATLSMAASGYFSSRESGSQNAGKSAVYTGVAYLITVALLIMPYLLFPSKSYMWALLTTLLIAIGIIAGFNFYTSVVKDRPFRRSFFSMAGISMGVAAISFVVGLLVKNVLGIDL